MLKVSVKRLRLSLQHGTDELKPTLIAVFRCVLITRYSFSPMPQLFRTLALAFLAMLPLLAAQPRTPTQEGIVFGVADHQSLTMDYYGPRGTGVHPVAIIIHGGGYQRGDSKSGSEAYCADFLAPSGYAVFSINYRLAPQYPYPNMVRDVERAIRFIRHNARQWDANPKQIALVGGSAGGFLSNMAGLLNAPGDPRAADPVDRESARVQAVVTLFAQSSFATVPLNKDVHALLDPLILQKGEAAALREASPITYVNKDAPPFLLIQGDRDEFIPFSESTNLQAALQKVGVRCDIIRIPNGTHGTGNWHKIPGVPDWERQMVAWLNARFQHAGAIGEGIRDRAPAQMPVTSRPKITGVAHIALAVHDIEKSRAFYKDFLGYGEPFQLDNKDGSLSLTFIKVNDRQYVELFPEKTPNTDRLLHISFEVEDAEAMRAYLRSQGVQVPDRVGKGRIGNLNFMITDPDGHLVEIVQYASDGFSMRDRGKFLDGPRISNHMMHVGIAVGALEPAMHFYGDILGFQEIWRGSKQGKVLDWVNMRVPDGRDYLEFMMHEKPPSMAALGTMHHMCLEVPGIVAAMQQLKQRKAMTDYLKPMEIRTGVNRKRQLNLFDPDGTRIELMEAVTVDGVPAPSFHGPATAQTAPR
jgi:acetyl esterase/lipase/catechol 2,3-dioxygenase-like lactoylglutathione lyase family enzyme